VQLKKELKNCINPRVNPWVDDKDGFLHPPE